MEIRPILNKKLSMKDRINPLTALIIMLGFIIGAGLTVYFILKII